MFVTNSLSGGGAERATNILVNALKNSGIQVSLVAINDGQRDLIKPTCEVFELHREWKGGLVSVFNAYIGIQKAIWRWRPDFLVLNCDIPELLGSITIGKHKLVAVEHASQPWPQRQSLGKFVRKLLRFRKTKWVAVSDHLKVWGLDILPNFVINNPIDSWLPLNGIKENQDINKMRRLVFVGRLSPEKNPILLVSVAKDVNLPVTFIGSGVQSEIVREMCKLNGVTADFRGFVKDPWAEIQPMEAIRNLCSRTQPTSRVAIPARCSHGLARGSARPTRQGAGRIAPSFPAGVPEPRGRHHPLPQSRRVSFGTHRGHSIGSGDPAGGSTAYPPAGR